MSILFLNGEAFFDSEARELGCVPRSTEPAPLPVSTIDRATDTAYIVVPMSIEFLRGIVDRGPVPVDAVELHRREDGRHEFVLGRLQANMRAGVESRPRATAELHNSERNDARERLTGYRG